MLQSSVCMHTCMNVCTHTFFYVSYKILHIFSYFAQIDCSSNEIHFIQL